MTHPARNDSFAWVVAFARDIALIVFCVVYVLENV